MDPAQDRIPDSRRYADGDLSFKDFATESPALARALEEAAVLAASPRAIHLRAETGCGKNFLARAIHNASPRKDGPFIEVNVGGLPETLLYSALFGHRKGAFTGADSNRAGAFELADGGTLFLDEIGDVPLACQPVLLRGTSQRVHVPLGGKPFQADVRIITATHRDLERMVQEGGFREDLYHRICGLDLVVPPLRERREDLRRLLFAYLRAEGRADLAAEEAFEPEAWARIDAYAWPGNLRELRDEARRVALLVRRQKVQAGDLRLKAPMVRVEGAEAGKRATDAMRRHAQALVGECGGSVREAAIRMGRSIAQMYRYLGKGGSKA